VGDYVAKLFSKHGNSSEAFQDGKRQRDRYRRAKHERHIELPSLWFLLLAPQRSYHIPKKRVRDSHTKIAANNTPK
jgi:hypothetical protein